MHTDDDILPDRSVERVARVSAQFESERGSIAPAPTASTNSSRRVIEVPCELAPAVLRRFVRRRPE